MTQKMSQKQMMKQMMEMTGKIPVRLYEKNIQKSGSSVFEFAGIKLVHRSIKADKSDFVVHSDTKAVIFAMPLGSERARALDYLANKIDLLRSFIDSPDGYEVISLSDLSSDIVKEPQCILELVSAPHNISLADIKPEKKSFNLKEAKW